MKNESKVKDNLTNMGREWLFFNKNSLKNSTLQTYEYILDKHIAESALSYCSIGKITSEDIVDYSRKLLTENLSPKTVNTILLEINSIFKFAKTMYGINPPYIKYVRDMKNEMRVLTVAEQEKLELYLRENPDNYNLGVLFALYTGVRIGELCALKWENISDGAVRINKTMHRLRDENGKSRVMIDNPKTPSSNRTIPLPDFLSRIVESRRDSDGSYFLAGESVKMVEPRLMQKHFGKITELCALDGVTFHTLRHTFTTRCIECGFDAKTLSEILGHSDVKTTLNRYVHCSLELKRNSMNLLERLAV